MARTLLFVGSVAILAVAPAILASGIESSVTLAEPPASNEKAQSGAIVEGRDETGPPATTQKSSSARQRRIARLVRAAAKDGRLAYRLTEPAEVIELIGPPTQEETFGDGGMEVRRIRYPGASFVFGRMRDEPVPFTLLRLTAQASTGLGRVLSMEEQVDIGEERKIALRTTRDLQKLDSFRGLENISLARLDLRDRADILQSWTFDTRTEWPAADKLPAGFDPEKLLESGKDPGLGVRGLHRQGIDGRGMHMAIIDQPLLRDHREYRQQIEAYEAIDVLFAPPQMHGPPVASIAVGRTCGVAPAAKLTYFAVPTWNRDNAPFCDALERILERNEKRPAAERIHAVSISSGMFSNQPNFDRWQGVLKRATAAGVLVVTCDPAFLRYGTLDRMAGRDPDDPASYRRGKYSSPNAVLRVPAGGHTTASYNGPDVYEYWADGGMSWCAPYLAGLATLAFQVDADITPERITQLWLETATTTDVGAVVNPPGFIEQVRKTAAHGS
ncbi:MAG TPA: S8/S53 family peptidase [Phycisphaerae bacterium]|nr:S8/S53 family peptidase [Phycisphaerae bacterium]